ncbi:MULTISPECIES: group II intron reverse transcriptase/maturase [Bacillus]|nr:MULTISPECIES: group II intron reverse transcriptase/maturase [Bacillus cereus group]OUA67966.1 group II intron reverse transcriptase/maturase [Bacillus thuringiensis serovar thailandensis]ADH09955.1 Group II intron reverse transcriptase/maturase [Bacillus thuringiensis BMB171]MCU5203281.1 group II intron reverse transcriptase/maturase [Bacillus paranthracis]MDA2044037.1 group II intron reverse transcriptase/maturase [Bacillus cereus]MEC1632661.1 group II intron reverse transcriptase/maturas
MSNRLEMERKPKKHKKLRFNEYYDTQQLFDDLYNRSSKGEIFKNLISLIMSEENIKLAYRNIKRNKGSYTKGSNDTTILEIAEQNLTTFVAKVQKALENYNPKPIRRVYIPKRNGDKRPLGIPTMEDRIVQQCIKQILEPICEAKFYNHSYGFRPNRNAKHAIVRAMSLMNISKFHYVVDIDIKGFFDNVNHGKLLKQIWSLGIRDKSLLSIISKILKTEIENVGKMEKGTPQGGIISPLLSNIVLNELDWWISSQWETMITRHNYESIDKRNNTIIRSHKYTALRRTSNLKEMFLVRYADDFKIFCKDFNSAQKTLIAVKKWLKNRLGLEVNNEKSKVTNLRRNYTEFLGFKLKVVKKKAKKTDYVVKSHITEQAKNNITEKYKKAIKRIKVRPHADEVRLLNSKILGFHNYYNIATMVNKDFADIYYKTKNFVYNRLHRISSLKFKGGETPPTFLKYYGKYNFKTYYIMEKPIYPIAGITHKSAKALNKEVNSYTERGRRLIHDRLKSINITILRYLMENPIIDQSIELNDNRISLYVGQNGKCAITKEPLEIGDMEVHHIIPKSKGGTDEYVNLIFVRSDIHKLFHAKKKETINYYLDKIGILSRSMIRKINKMRTSIGNEEI